MSANKPFTSVFPKISSAGLPISDWLVQSAQIQKETRTATIAVVTSTLVPPSLRGEVELAMANLYRLNRVEINLSSSVVEMVAPSPNNPKSTPKSTSSPSKKSPKTSGKMIFGRKITKEITPISEVDLDMGQIAVEGDIFSVDHRDLKKRRAFVISFDLTDYTSSIRINAFMEAEQAQPIIKGIKKGMRVQVQGSLSIDRFYNDIVLNPNHIMAVEKPMRMDTHPQKRVELHLHTNMSAMDGLTSVDPKHSPDVNVVKRAEAWGHPAIAVTDHAIAHSFPNAWHSAKEIKILYGTEAYFLNDLDDRVVVQGSCQQTFDEEIVCFDIETTGLKRNKEAITEIGAVVLKNGEIVDSFQTFLNPERRLTPEIIKLTGITDQMLEGAPSQEEGVRAFLDFIGNRPLAAHNADFDMGFIDTACDKFNLSFENSVVDTLILAQNLFPTLGKFKLDIVAKHLGLPEFNHHRAVDDATVVAKMLVIFWDKLRELDLSTLDDINPKMLELRPLGNPKRKPRHLIVLAKNQEGLKNLYRLISLAHLDHFKRFPIMPKSLIEQYKKGLIFGSACEAGELFDAMVSGRRHSELKRIASWYDYLEIQPICNNQFMIRKGIVDNNEDLRNFNRTLVSLGKEIDKPVCATGDVHFLDPEDEVYRHILLASKKYDDATQPLPIYFKTTQEMLDEFSYLGEDTALEVVVTNTNLIANSCDNVVPLPKGLYTPTLENSEQELLDLVHGKVKELYGDDPPELVTTRVQTELTDIISCKYDVIYMSAQKLVKDSLDHGYLVGSRGSVGSSLVAFMSGITEVNSLPAHYRCPNCKHSDFEYGAKNGFGCGADMPDAICPQCGTQYDKDGFHIPFETFLGFSGDKVPDIDLNFSGEYQAEAHKYTFELFGKNHVFRAGTVGTVAQKTAYGYAKKYLDDQMRTVSKAEENRLATGCTGVKRSSGQHPGGMVVIPQDKEIYDFCPVQRPADDPHSDIITTHFEYHSMESNLLKLDILGHDDPTMIRMMEDLTGVNAQKIPLDDTDTMSIFQSSKALGFENDPQLGPTGACAIPEFGTSFVRGMLLDTMPTQFDTLVRLSGFSHGTDVWLDNAKDLISSGTATVNQAIGCRDDIMIYLISLGMDEKFAFKIMEAVRKGKGLPEGAEEQMRELQVPEWYIGSCKKIAYLFPKAHAVAYVMMAFRIAWFKVHHPLAFYAAYFTVRAKAVDQAFMCRGMDVCKKKIFAIKAKDKDATDVEKNMLTTLEVCYEFYLRGFTFNCLDFYNADATKFLVSEETKSLTPPFISVAGLGEAAALSLSEQREGKSFVSIEEIANACPKVSKTHIQLLTEAGSFGNLPATSQLDLFSMF